MQIRKLLFLFGAAALAVQPQLAAAQAPCVSEDEVSAMAIYAVPSVVRGAQLRCAEELSSGGFLARQGDAFAARYAALQNRVWPKAKSGLLKLVNSGVADAQAAQSIALVAGLPDENVRPLVDALIVQEVSPRIATGKCTQVERVMAALAPIEPEIAGTLIGVAAGLFGDKQPQICPARPA